MRVATRRQDHLRQKGRRADHHHPNRRLAPRTGADGGNGVRSVSGASYGAKTFALEPTTAIGAVLDMAALDHRFYSSATSTRAPTRSSFTATTAARPAGGRDLPREPSRYAEPIGERTALAEMDALNHRVPAPRTVVAARGSVVVPDARARKPRMRRAPRDGSLACVPKTGQPTSDGRAALARTVGVVAPDQLRRTVDPACLPFETTADVAPLGGMTSQPRAHEALELALDLDAPGYNVFATGPAGTGKRSVLEGELRRRAAARPAPRDWVYVHDFAAATRPAAIALPSGRGPQLARDISGLVEDARREVHAAFDSDAYIASSTGRCTSASTAAAAR